MNASAAPRRCLIAGCGDLGVRAGRKLAAAGWQVDGLRRSATALPPPLALLRADLTDAASLRALGDTRYDAVVFTPTPDQRDADAYRAIYLDGLVNLLGALVHRPERVVFVGSTAVYGDADGNWQDEASPPAPAAWNGELLLEAERALLDSGVARPSVLRLAGLYGPGREALLRRARARQPCRSAPPHWTCRIHIDDAAGAIAHLLQLAQPESHYIGIDDEPAYDCAVLAFIAEALGLDPGAYRLAAAAPLAHASGKRLSNRRLRDSGYDFAYPSFRQGYGALCAGSMA